MGNWANDVANWNQKWKLTDGAICLENVQTQPQAGMNDLPWFGLLPQTEPKNSKNVKAPLWSPPIPKVAGMRCITMEYNFQGDSDVDGSYSLAILQQQDGYLIDFFIECCFTRLQLLLSFSVSDSSSIQM